MTTNNTNNSENKLQFATYTSEKTGKTCPVVYGFSGKDDERLTYICNMESAPKGKKGKKAEKKVHGYAYCVYSCLAIDGTNRVPCAIWGADPRWHDVAKYAAEVINDLDTLTQEQYNKLGAMAEAVYNARKAENKALNGEAKKTEAKTETARVSPKGTGKKGATKKEAPKKEEPKKGEPAPEVSATGSKPAPKVQNGELYTFDELSTTVRNAFSALAQKMNWETSILEPLIEAALRAAKTNKTKVA